MWHKMHHKYNKHFNIKGFLVIQVGSTPLISTKIKSLDIQGFFYFLLCINAFACLSSHTFFRV